MHSITLLLRQYQWHSHLIFSLLWVNLSGHAITGPDIDNSRLQQQRQHYTAAKQAFRRNDSTTYTRLKAKLQDYPLYPYLEYGEITRRLSQLPYRQIDQFLERYRDSHLADQLLVRWLRQLARGRHWRDYKRYYHPNLNSTALHCQYLWSRLKTGDQSIYPQVAALWNVGKSQPAECDKLFNQWKQAGYLTPEIAWERHRKSVTTGNDALARYVARTMPAAMQYSAELYRRIDDRPKMIKDTSLLQTNTQVNRDTIIHGLQRYARIDAAATRSLWRDYRDRYTFTTAEQDKLNLYIAIQRARQGHIDRDHRLAISNRHHSARVNQTIWITTILQQLLKQQRWHDILLWIEQLPVTAKQSDRWRYWRARALAEAGIVNAAQEVEAIYRKLSAQRSYYGFLAADQLGLDYAFTHSPVAIADQLLKAVAAVPGLQRALELFALNKMYTARHEWSYATRDFSTEQHIAAAQLAHKWGWNRKAIESMAAARYWDDLDIRFPLAHAQLVNRASKEIQLPDTLIYAIARQESAWAADAVSSAGARGLMQIMPRTARQTADSIGLDYNKQLLLQPEQNILIGSHYIHQLIRRYNGNRLLAIAAYNAGPSRVNRWLKRSGQQLPYDVWIEVIPFKETRKYVQNVLSYTVIYGYLTGRPVALVTAHEAQQTL